MDHKLYEKFGDDGIEARRMKVDYLLPHTIGYMGLMGVNVMK